MNKEIEKILTLGDIFESIETEEKAFEFLNYIQNLQEENTDLQELADKYEEEHNTEFKIWKDERKQLKDYKLRNEKAIEYIQNKIEESKNLQDYSKWYVENYDKAIDLTNSSHGGIMLETIKSTTIKRYEDVLNILKGE